MAIFSRIKKGEDDNVAALNPDSELDLPMKPASRPSAGRMVTSRPAVMPGSTFPENRPRESRGVPSRGAETRTTEGNNVAEIARPADMARRFVEAPPAARNEPELRKLTVGREITLQGEITQCDQLIVEGTVTANLSCQDVAIMESGVLKGTVEIGQVEVRGLFEGTLNVSGRLLIRSTGRVVGKVRYGQVEIEIGGQISGEVEAQPQAKSANKNVAAAAPVPAAAGSL